MFFLFGPFRCSGESFKIDVGLELEMHTLQGKFKKHLLCDRHTGNECVAIYRKHLWSLTKGLAMTDSPCFFCWTMTGVMVCGSRQWLEAEDADHMH